jgi:hypothetical protein
MTTSHAPVQVVAWFTAVASALVAVVPGCGPTKAVPRPAQIILIRHAEKPRDPDNPHLSEAGARRAEQLVSFVTTNPGMKTFGLPVAVFATKTTKDGNGQRTQETLAPLARALRLRVQAPFTGKDYESLAKLVLLQPKYAGKTVLICWNHEQLPELAAALGVAPEPPKWKDGVYDLVYLIAYQDGKAKLATFRYGSR